MVLDKFGDGVEHRRVGGFAEVPIGNGTGDDQLLAGKDELGRPHQPDDINP